MAWTDDWDDSETEAYGQVIAKTPAALLIRFTEINGDESDYEDWIPVSQIEDGVYNVGEDGVFWIKTWLLRNRGML
jgi:hypothetical protein